jgi:signal transduction histidine kinase
MLDQFSGILNLLDKYHQLLQSAHSMPELAPLCGEIQSDAQRIDLDYLTEEIPQALNETLEGVERVARIVSAMKEFSHPGLGGKAPANLNRLVESTVTVARNEWKYVAEVELDLDCGLPAVPCTAGSINQVLLNLVINAAHAISQVADRESQEKRKIYISTHARGPWAEIRVTDEGPGIAPEIRDRIFDPFFTTKEPGKGTGQGLSIAHTVICDRHGGELTFETERGKGTTFIVRLPVNPPDWPPEIQ